MGDTLFQSLSVFFCVKKNTASVSMEIWKKNDHRKEEAERTYFFSLMLPVSSHNKKP